MRTTRAKRNTIRRRRVHTERELIRKLGKLCCLTGLSVVCALSVCHAYSTTKIETLGAQHLQDEYEVEPAYLLPTDLGEYRITFYCACENCCGEWAEDRPQDPETGLDMVYGSSGNLLTPGYSCATSSKFSQGDVLYIDGYGYVRVDDTVADWVADKYDDMVVDIYLAAHNEMGAIRNDLGDYSKVYYINK